MASTQWEGKACSSTGRECSRVCHTSLSTTAATRKQQQHKLRQILSRKKYASDLLVNVLKNL